MTKDEARLQLNAAAILGGFKIDRKDDGLTHYTMHGLPLVRVLFGNPRFGEDCRVIAFTGTGTLGAGDPILRDLDQVADYLRNYQGVAA